LPKDALVRLGSIRFRVEGYVLCVASSPDGKLIAAGDSEGLVYLWEAATGKILHRLAARAGVLRVVFSPDGRRLLARARKGEVTLWDVASGQLTGSFRRDNASDRWSDFLIFTADSRQVIAVPDANELIILRGKKHEDTYVLVGLELKELAVELLDPTTGKSVKHLATGRLGTIFSDAALSPDGKLLALGMRAYKAPRKQVQLIDVATGNLVREIQDEGEGWFLSMAFAPDGKTLALGGRDEIVLADVGTGKLTGKLTSKMDTVAFLGFSPDGKSLVSHGHDNKIRTWDLASGKQLLEIPAEADGYTRLPVPGSLFRRPPPQELRTRTNATTLLKDGKTVAVGASATVALWDVAAGKRLLPQFGGTDGWATALEFSPDGRSLVVAGADQARIWDAASGEIRHVLPTWIGLAAFSPDGLKLAVARHWNEEGKDAQVAVLWDIAAGKELHRLLHPPGQRFEFARLAFTPDGKKLITLTVHQTNAGYQDNTVVHQWDVDSGKLLGRIHREDTCPWRPTVAPDGRTAVIERPKDFLLVNLETGQDIRALPGAPPDGMSGTPTYSPDGQVLYVWHSYGFVSVWEVATGTVISRFRLTVDGTIPVERWPNRGGKKELDLSGMGQAEIEMLVVSPDGRYLASSERYEGHFLDMKPRSGPTPPPAIRIWNAATGKEIQRLDGFHSRSTSLAFSPDGRRLASWLHNGTVLIWDTERKDAATGGSDKPLTVERREQLWSDLAAPDGATAYRAIAALEAVPRQATDLLSHQVRPAPPEEIERVRQLLAALDSDKFTERETAIAELKPFAWRYETVLCSAMKNSASGEVRKRLGTILSVPRSSPVESLRTIRAIQALERIGAPEARRLLAKLAAGAAGARETRAAETAVERAARREALPNGKK
jgi:WD40 repeat protein